MIKDDILTKKVLKKTDNKQKNNAQKNIIFFVFFRFGAPQNRGSRVGVVTISWKPNKNDVIFRVVFFSFF